MRIYKILKNGYYDGYLDVPDDIQGIPFGTTRTEIIDIPENKFAKWTGSGWEITSHPPPAEVMYATEEIIPEESFLPFDTEQEE
jgi:hypothetical protein